MKSLGAIAVGLGLLTFLGGCCHPSITATSLSPLNACEGDGIPFYLPKPLLIIAKNFRYVEEAKVGLTDSVPIPNSFDDQAKYADINARTNFNAPEGTGSTPGANGGGSAKKESDPTNGSSGTGTASGQHIYSDKGPSMTPVEAPHDGLTPDTFYTYQIIFVPDMTQKYGLKVKGGVGEIRAALNLVNGWQFTGLGPFYMKDSSTAQNIMASGIAAELTGRGVADVIKSLADLRSGGAKAGNTEAALAAIKAVADLGRTDTYAALPCPQKMLGYAEIHVLEPYLTPEGQMEWREIFGHQFDRDVMGVLAQRSGTPGVAAPAAGPTAPAPSGREVVPLPTPTIPSTGAAIVPVPGTAVLDTQRRLIEAIIQTVQPAQTEATIVDPGSLRMALGNALLVPPATGAEATPVPAAAAGGTVNNNNNNVNVNCTEGGGLRSLLPSCMWHKAKSQIQSRHVVGLPTLGTVVTNPNAPVRSGENVRVESKSSPGSTGTLPATTVPAAGVGNGVPLGVFQQYIGGPAVPGACVGQLVPAPVPAAPSAPPTPASTDKTTGGK